MVFVSSCKDFWKFYVAYVTKINSTEMAINPLKVKNLYNNYVYRLLENVYNPI